MIIDVYATMRNEATILPYWLRHYGSFASRLFVWDDESDDGTTALLDAHPLVTRLTPAVHGIDDTYWVRTLWPQIQTLSQRADWAIVVDADEFVHHPRLLDVLVSHLAQGDPLLGCVGYEMLAHDIPHGDGQIYDEIRTAAKGTVFSDKPCIVRPTTSVMWAPGRHFLHPAKLAGSIATWTPTRIKLLHYRYLGHDYCEARSARNLARMSDANVKCKYHRSNRPGAMNPGSTLWLEARWAESFELDLTV
jgi:hypothetical protein